MKCSYFYVSFCWFYGMNMFLTKEIQIQINEYTLN